MPPNVEGIVTTADYALVVSICSAGISLLSFGWNVWSKFIYPKAQVRVRFYTGVIVGGGEPPWPRFLMLTATNFGPTELTLESVGILISRGPFKQPQPAMANPIHNVYQPHLGVGPFAGGLPKKLAIGESHNAYFPFDATSFGREELKSIHYFDNFGRRHPATKRQIRKVKVDLDKAFWSEPYVSTLPPERDALAAEQI